ncbi:MAG: hypothetical protein NC912_03600 [Candidatus Omnitrophica bacterium]|nr:hypothetical protein [Candidatus Omnitrophota bacterium]
MDCRKKILIFLILISVILNQSLYAQHMQQVFKIKPPSLKEKIDEFIASLNLYNRIITYIQNVRAIESEKDVKPSLFKTSNIIDIFLSFFSLFIVMYFFMHLKNMRIRKYLWFIFIWNIAWFVELFVLRGVWSVLNLILGLRPDLEQVIQDNSCLIFIIVSSLIYIWLLARSFSLDFKGALSTFLASHLIYFIFAFLAIQITLSLGLKRFHYAFKQDLGAYPIFRDYIMDNTYLAKEQSVLSLLKIKGFHL